MTLGPLDGPVNPVYDPRTKEVLFEGMTLREYYFIKLYVSIKSMPVKKALDLVEINLAVIENHFKERTSNEETNNS